ncbi:MAG TPA: hypothetical protein VFX37_06000 [Pseudolabrys sp.]|nr:hypothetical protein [Pseudolabrys sp.]
MSESLRDPQPRHSFQFARILKTAGIAGIETDLLRELDDLCSRVFIIGGNELKRFRLPLARLRHDCRADLVERFDHFGSGFAGNDFRGRLVGRDERCEIISEIIGIDAVNQDFTTQVAAVREHVVNRAPINGKNDNLCIRNRIANGLQWYSIVARIFRIARIAHAIDDTVPCRGHIRCERLPDIAFSDNRYTHGIPLFLIVSTARRDALIAPAIVANIVKYSDLSRPARRFPSISRRFDVMPQCRNLMRVETARIRLTAWRARFRCGGTRLRAS